MYSDNSLLPRETIRLAALGTLAGGPRAYADLAQDVRHFISRIVGPSLELMGASIELLRHEGLVESCGGAEDGPLALTGAGHAELRELLRSAVRPPSNDVNKLAMALKMRFMHLLTADEQRAQADMMIEACRGEVARLIDLRAHHHGDDGHLVDWLDHDIGLIESRLDWLQALRDRI